LIAGIDSAQAPEPVTGRSTLPAEAGRRPARPLRLAYLITQYPKVSHTFIRREIRELERRGHAVLRLAIRPADSALVDPEDLRESSRTLHCVTQPLATLARAQFRVAARHPRGYWRALRMAVRMGRRSERGLAAHLAYVVEAAFLLERLCEHRVEHVHVHFGRNAAAVARLIRCMGGPSYSFTVHGPDEFDAPRSLRLGDKQADASFVIAISDYCSAQLRRWSRPEDWPRIHVVRCGVGENFFSRARPVDGRSRTFVCVGRLCPQKGQLLLIEAVARLKREGLALDLVLAGDGEMRGEIERRLRDLDVADRVKITGWIPETVVVDQVLAARALVLPSFAEGLPVVIMEAMALGRPVISTFVAGIPELVRPGETGWLVPAGNAEALADALRQALAATAGELQAMGLAARARVRAAHDIVTEAGRLESLLLTSGGSHA
jgi:glycosyltransferase involved in cell wall biosynthesis